MRDLDIRNSLKSTRLKRYYTDGTSRVVEELGLCTGDARVDIAVINGAMHAYEIKSEQDTLTRLPNQIEIYSRVFDYLSVCVGPKHLAGVLKMVPSCWGVILAVDTQNSISLTSVRPATRNPGVDQYSLAQLLWKDEVTAALNSLGISKGLSGKSKADLWKLFAEAATPKYLSQYVRATLKARANWRSDS
jgi:hypothetical protein